jgi:hypothetical protein
MICNGDLTFIWWMGFVDGLSVFSGYCETLSCERFFILINLFDGNISKGPHLY